LCCDNVNCPFLFVHNLILLKKHPVTATLVSVCIFKIFNFDFGFFGTCIWHLLFKAYFVSPVYWVILAKVSGGWDNAFCGNFTFKINVSILDLSTSWTVAGQHLQATYYMVRHLPGQEHPRLRSRVLLLQTSEYCTMYYTLLMRETENFLSTSEQCTEFFDQNFNFQPSDWVKYFSISSMKL